MNRLPLETVKDSDIEEFRKATEGLWPQKSRPPEGQRIFTDTSDRPFALPKENAA